MKLKEYIEELKRRNVFKVGVAYLVVSWLIIQVTSIFLEAFNAPPFVLKTILFILVLGFPVILIFSWVYEITSEGLKKTKKINQNKTESHNMGNRLNKVIIVSLSIAVLVLLFNNFYNSPSSVKDSATKSIAVLAFTNMSSDKEQDYFCDGIAEDILNDLVYVEGLQVAARTSSFVFKGKNKDVREIGKELGVDFVLEGSVQKSENTLRITAQLIKVSDGYHVWSKRYNRELKDVFSIQNEIAQKITQALKIKLTKSEKKKLVKIQTPNTEAYDFYMRGRYYFYKGHRDELSFSIKMFEKAIEIDENYALAYAGIADCYSEAYMYFDKSEENLQQTLKYSEKALLLDPELAEAHSARGHALAQNKQYEDAEKEFEKAIQLNPKLFVAYYQYGRMLRSIGKHKKSAKQFEKAIQIEPNNYQPWAFLHSAYKNLNLEAEMLKARKQAIKVVRKHLDFNPDDARALYLGAITLIEEKEIDEGVLWLEKSISINPNDISVLYNAACLYSLMDKKEVALNYLDKAIKAGFASRNWLDNDSDLDNIRNHPRFKTIVNNIKE